MDPTLLQQFRQQLASWIESRMGSQRLPFQRLEICPETLTDRGNLTPDLVLWINRDSQLAGSMILLPEVVNERSLADGVSLARALGLGHFTTWAAHDVSIWSITSNTSSLLSSFALPPANRITPENFQRTLNDLLEKLKVVTVTSAPAMAEFSEHYYANLCLRNLQELIPCLTMSARMTAGQTATDSWVEHAPREKAWMSLWRILFLLWHGRLPPGLQPERLELTIHYALADLTTGTLTWLDIRDSEPPLPEEAAIRLHHLASRMRQLEWPHNDVHALGLLNILLEEAARRFGLMSLFLPWDKGTAKLRIGCQLPPSEDNCCLIAPREYLAGYALKASLNGQEKGTVYAEGIQTLNNLQELTSAIAVMKEIQPLDRKERATCLIMLRKVWPSRRFDLPHNTPAWLWDSLYLSGLISEDLSLSLPQDWHRAPGIMTLWATLTERFHLAEIFQDETGAQSLRFVQATQCKTPVQVHRGPQTIEVPCEPSAALQPGTIQVWLNVNERVLELLGREAMISTDIDWPDQSTLKPWGIFLFLHTRLGRYLWGLCSDHSALPELDTVLIAVSSHGLPLPNEEILSDLCLIGDFETLTLPEPELLEREFTGLFGSVPELPQSSLKTAPYKPKARRRNRTSSEHVSIKVFQDGIPRFPEHYLMHIYRPELTHYDLCGPLEIAEEFFDCISLITVGRDHTIKVSGKITAEALILASYSGETKVSLPQDESIIEGLVQSYRSDLSRLWDSLTRECRRFEPHRQTAVKMARRIWQQQGLPPESIHGSE